MKAFHTLTSRVIALPRENIDTDQIVPARFLSVTRFEGLADAAFADWRFDESGNEIPDCPLNDPQNKARSILVAGHNFGCGSSREHAPRALLQFGIRVVLSTQIADIFRNNALTCGLLAVEVAPTDHGWMLENPEQAVRVDLEHCSLELANGHRSGFQLDGFARHCLMSGTDTLGYLLGRQARISQFEEARS
jgi:3-isopropylmalate/(R)-2-methylmalate dehydratase small subunit